MSEYYNANRVKGLYDPRLHQGSGGQAFKLSRSKIDLFIECPRCFYLDRRLGVARPPGFPFALNSAVDALLKKEFDLHRAKGERHPLMEKYGIDAVPIGHEKLAEWRHNFTGIQYLHEPTNLLIFGAIDDLWAREIKEAPTSPRPLLGQEGKTAANPLSISPLVRGRGSRQEGKSQAELFPSRQKSLHLPTASSPLPNPPLRKGREELEYIVVDYKATSKEEEIKALDKDWQDGYKRQMEVYQWLLRHNGLRVSDTGYFVYCNGKTDRKAFDAKLEFDISVIPYKGNDAWVEKTIVSAHQCLNDNRIPLAGKNCDYCAYVKAVSHNT